MNNKELFAKMAQSIIDSDKDEAVRLANEALETGIEPTDAIDEGFVKGIQVVGDLFEREEIYLPELVMAADAIAGATEVLSEAIKKSGKEANFLGKGVAGAVQGDLHDIGIRLVTTMLIANGFDIEFLGTDIPASRFVEKAKETNADLILLSSLLTTTMSNQKEVIASLKEAGLREQVKVIVGGAPVTEGWVEEIEADGYGENAVAAVQVVKHVMGV